MLTNIGLSTTVPFSSLTTLPFKQLVPHAIAPSFLQGISSPHIAQLWEGGQKTLTSIFQGSPLLQSTPPTIPVTEPEHLNAWESVQLSLHETLGQMLDLGTDMIIKLPVAAGILGLSWYLSQKYTATAIDKIGDIFNVSKDKEAHVATAVKMAVMGAGTVFALETMGVDVFNIVGNIGMVGIALGLVAQDVAKDIAASVQVKSSSSYKKGNKINIGGKYFGIVENVDFFRTVLSVEQDGVTKKIIIPNTEIKGLYVIIEEDHDAAIPDLDATDKTKVLRALGLTTDSFGEGLQKLCFVEIANKPERSGQVIGITNSHLVLQPFIIKDGKINLEKISRDTILIPLAEVLKSDIRIINPQSILKI